MVLKHEIIFKLLTSYSFSLRQKTKNEDGEFETKEVTVHDYFVNYRKMELRYSSDLPCINVGKPKKPIFLPIEVEHWDLSQLRFMVCLIINLFLLLLFGYLQYCSLVSLQRYTKSLNTMQRASLVEKSRQKPPERMRVLTDVRLNKLIIS